MTDANMFKYMVVAALGLIVTLQPILTYRHLHKIWRVEPDGDAMRFGREHLVYNNITSSLTIWRKCGNYYLYAQWGGPPRRLKVFRDVKALATYLLDRNYYRLVRKLFPEEYVLYVR